MADSILLMSRWKKVQAYFGGVQHSYRAPNLVKNTYRYKKTIYRKYAYVRVAEKELEIDPKPDKV